MKYRYSGPISAVTLKDGREVMLHPGKTVELPAEHEYTQTLLALGHLTPKKDSPPAASGSDAPAPTKASTKSTK
jgi:hypothetical protein